MYEEQLLLVERLRRRAKKENQPINRLISKEEVELGECESCALLREQLAKKEVLVSACRTDLEEIKKQMAGYAMIRTQESAEEAELKNKIIAKL